MKPSTRGILIGVGIVIYFVGMSAYIIWVSAVWQKGG